MSFYSLLHIRNIPSIAKKVGVNSYLLIVSVRKLTQEVLNRQIGSLKSSQFQIFFSQGKNWLRMLIFFQKSPYLPNFNPPKKKTSNFFVWASSADPKQQTELSKKREKWFLPVFIIESKWIIYTLMTIFWRIFLLKFKLRP